MARNKYNQRSNVFYITILIIIGFLGYFTIRYFIDYTLVDVVVLNSTHQQRSKINEDDIKIMKVPKYLVNDEILIKKNEIINHYVKLQEKIYANSLIHKSSIENNDEFNDYGNLLLKENESAYSIVMSSTEALSNNIKVGMSINLYLTIEENNKIISDLLFKNVRVIGVKNGDGNNLINNEVPYLIVIAIKSKFIPTLNVCNKIGDYSIYPSNNSYSSFNTEFNDNSKIILYIEDYLGHISR